MSTINQTIALYEHDGALLTPGPNQILAYTDFQANTPGDISVDDTNNDDQWDFVETATVDGEVATLVATGTATFGVTIVVDLPLPFPDVNVTVPLSSSVQVAVFEVDGVQYVRFYNADGTEADPAALLDGLTTAVIAELGVLLGPVEAVVGPIAAYVENNALLTFNLTSTEGVQFTCFAAGTLIATAEGERRIEELEVGSQVLTVDHGLQTVRWIGRRSLSSEELALAPNLVPIRIEAGALGDGLPHKRLIVSPQHRCLVRSAIAERMFGERELLVAAKHLLDLPGVSLAPPTRPVTYVHLLFDRHELLWSNGSITESFYLGDQALTAVGRAARDEILHIFPELAGNRSKEIRPPAARPFLRGRVARKLVERAVRNHKPLVEAEEAPVRVSA